DIDRYALTQVASYKNRMQILRNLLTGHEDILSLKYEDMVLNTEAWLNQISHFVDQPVTDALRQKLGDKIDFTVSKENVARHKRQVTPGDHKRKLKPETIAEMSDRLRDELEFFGYDIEG